MGDIWQINMWLNFNNLNKSKQKILWMDNFSGHILHECKQLHKSTLG
jgi:hypothetical protein